MWFLLFFVAWAGWPEAARRPIVQAEIPADFEGDVFLVAGHGAGDSTGNIGIHGQTESEVTLDLTLALGEALEATGAFDVFQGRRPGEFPFMTRRINRFLRSPAPVMIEVHTDVRLTYAEEVERADGTSGLRNDEEPGFSVLFNEGSAIGGERRALARALARGLATAGLPPFTVGYGELYDKDEVPGVFIDRRGLKMLRAPTRPSVIIETHHALDFEESLRWREKETRARFAAGVITGLLDYLSD